MTWYNTFDSAFWLTIAGIVSAGFAMMLKMCLKSKCTNINICGMTCVRDVKAELEEDRIIPQTSAVDTL